MLVHLVPVPRTLCGVLNGELPSTALGESRIKAKSRTKWDLAWPPAGLVGSLSTGPEISGVALYEAGCAGSRRMAGSLQQGGRSSSHCSGFPTGNGIAAFESVPTAIYCFLRCMGPDPEIPATFNSLQRTLIYSISLGGDTDTIATMAGAIAGAYYGMEQVPESWQQSCEGYEETDVLAQSLHRVFQGSL